MEKTINQDEVNALLAAEIRKTGLNDAIKLDMVKEKVMQKIQEMSKGISEMENPAVAQGPTTFPNSQDDEEKFSPAPGVQQMDSELPGTGMEPTSAVGMEAGAQPLNVAYEPKLAVVPQVPDFLKDVEPSKIFIYDFNELSVGGENLSNKPFKTMEDPSISKSMQQMWSEKGITKSEVYQTKFEKIGDIVFDYKSGMSQFIERGAEPDINIMQQYKENPYAADPTKEVESYIKQNVDIDQKVNDVIQNIVKNYFLTNSERAVNDVSSMDYNNFPTTHNPIGSGIQTSAVVPQELPMFENTLTMKNIAKEYQKIETPKELIETIAGKSKAAKLIYEGKEVKKWMLGDKEYYLPSDPMSIRMCYIK
jgi:hypothetical protein